MEQFCINRCSCSLFNAALSPAENYKNFSVSFGLKNGLCSENSIFTGKRTFKYFCSSRGNDDGQRYVVISRDKITPLTWDSFNALKFSWKNWLCNPSVKDIFIFHVERELAFGKGEQAEGNRAKKDSIYLKGSIESFFHLLALPFPCYKQSHTQFPQWGHHVTSIFSRNIDSWAYYKII